MGTQDFRAQSFFEFLIGKVWVAGELAIGDPIDANQHFIERHLTVREPFESKWLQPFSHKVRLAAFGMFHDKAVSFERGNEPGDLELLRLSRGLANAGRRPSRRTVIPANARL